MSSPKVAPQRNELELIAAWDIGRLVVVAQLPAAPKLVALAMSLAFKG